MLNYQRVSPQLGEDLGWDQEETVEEPPLAAPAPATEAEPWPLSGTPCGTRWTREKWWFDSSVFAGHIV